MKFGKSDTTVDLETVKQYLAKLDKRQRIFFSEVCTVLQLILVMPATNASSERSFSALRRLKTYLRATMLQERLNNLLVLHVRKDKTDNIHVKKAAERFVGQSEYRRSVFGRFS